VVVKVTQLGVRRTQCLQGLWHHGSPVE
jgi:hypothetical protein